MSRSIGLIVLLVVFTVASSSGCQPSTSKPKTGTEPNVEAGSQANADPDEIVLAGEVLQKDWTKSMESWSAGGSDYFVLDTGDAVVAQKSAKEGVVLLPSDDVTRESLSRYVGQRVRVVGVYTEGVLYKPKEEDPMSQRPVGLKNGEVMRGAGLVVSKIEPTE